MKQHGFSIIELMVALFIGLMVSVSTIPMISTFEQSRKNNLAHDGMSGNAMSAMNVLSANVQNAGLGFINAQSFLCTDLTVNGVTTPNFSPLIIKRTIDGDTISFAGASDTSAASINRPISNGITTTGAVIKNNGSLSYGDQVLISTNGSCEVSVVASVAQSPTEPKEANVTFTGNAINFTTSSVITNIGRVTGATPTPLVYQRWGVSNGALRTTNILTNTTSIVSDTIVSLRAQYGVTEINGQSFSRWVDATDDFATLDSSNMDRIRYMRVALVTKNQYHQSVSEKAGSSVCTTTENNLIPVAGWVDFNGDPVTVDVSGIHDWQCYNYKVYTSSIPIRNFSWGLAKS